MNKSQKYFDPETLARIRPLGLRARTLIEGLVAGLHRSPMRGHSIEFAQHREYVPGDDLRQVDWKVYARSDRYYLKQYEDETNLTCYLLLDQSESMLYRGQHSSLSKLEYAQLIACSIAYLIISQQDSVGMATFSASIDDWVPASSSPSQLDDLIRIMEKAVHGKRTSLTAMLEETIARLKRPSLLVILSDMLDGVDDTLRGLKLARHAGHDLMVLLTLDKDEIEFPFDQMSEFEGMENLPSLTTDPLLIASAYRQAVAGFQSRLKICCQQLGGDYFCMRTDRSLAHSLPQILAARSMRGR
ncbi:MAG: DUF58 domain-containing protein [bacterium]|nr:DUF58 domain-containing protein [bacterium]